MSNFKILFLIITLISFISTGFASTVRVDDFDELFVYAGNTSAPTETIYFESPSSSDLGNDVDNPLTIYMPFDSTNAKLDYIFFTDKTKVPKARNSATEEPEAVISLVIKATNSTTEVQYLNAAVRNSNDQYEAFDLSILGESTREISAATTSEISLRIDLEDICQQVDTFNYCDGDLDIEETMQLYFYLSDSLENGDDVEEDEDGFFVDLKISDKVPEGNYTVESVERGDNQLRYNISGGDDITEMGNNFLNILVFIYGGSTEQNPISFGTSTAEYFKELLDGTDDNDDGSDNEDDEEEETKSFKSNEEVDNGTVLVDGLENELSYNLAFAKINKYLFLSNLSNSMVGTPQNITTFLEESSCYLLSAGFQTNHYVLDYFRNFRDQYLLTNSWGRSLVHRYYDTAPKYTPIIYKSNIISFVVRCIGHFLYVVFNFWFIILGFMVVVWAAITLKRKPLIS